LTKALENNNDVNSARQLTTQSRITNCDPLKTSQINTEPFKITIDTHVIHKENMAPETKTNLYSPPPIANQTQIQSYESRRAYVQQLSPYSSSRMPTIRPLSPAPVSPYSSKVGRQI
jgi:hypothetical protein